MFVVVEKVFVVVAVVVEKMFMLVEKVIAVVNSAS